MAVSLGLLPAQAKPNFTGTWKLNSGQSDFGAMPAPDTRTDKIAHEDPALKDSFTRSGPMREVTAEMNYSTDGKETTNSICGSQIKSTAKWEGDELAIAGKVQFNGADVTLSDRWVLSADRKTLTIAQKPLHGAAIAYDMIWPGVRQPCRRQSGEEHRPMGRR